jgi:hypothetical protein
VGKSESDTDKSTGLSIYPIEKTMNDDHTYPVFLQSYLSFVGFKFPTYGMELKTSPSSYVLFLLENGELKNCVEEVVDGTQLLRIDIESNVLILDVSYEVKPHFFSCWVDPKLNYAVKRLDITLPSGELILTAINDDFKKVSGNEAYLPQKTKVDYYFLNKIQSKTSEGPLYTQEYTLLSYSTKNIDLSQFDLRKTFQQPGVMVTDKTFREDGAGITFLVPANPADLDRMIEAALTGKSFVPTPISSPFTLVFRWGLVIIGLCMIIYALFRMFTRVKT